MYVLEHQYNTCHISEKLPFPHWQLNNFLKVDPSVIECVEKELIKYPSWHRKENDLYSLLQTPDLQTLNAAKYPAITGFRSVIPCYTHGVNVSHFP